MVCDRPENIEAGAGRPRDYLVGVSFSRVEDGRGGYARRSLLRFPSPLIKPDVLNCISRASI